MRSKNRPNGRSFIEQARRAQVIDAAVKTIAEFGYANTSLSRIAETAQISKSVISYHFSNKDELLTEVVLHLFTSSWERVEPRLHAETTALGKVSAWITEQLNHFGNHPDQAAAIGQIVGNHRTTGQSRRFESEIESSVTLLAGIIADGQRNGELADVDPTVAAVTINSAVEGAISRSVAVPGTDLNAYAVNLVKLATRALTDQDGGTDND